MKLISETDDILRRIKSKCWVHAGQTKKYIDIIKVWKIEIEIILDPSFSKGFQKIISNIILLLLFGICTTYLFNIHIRTRSVEVSVNVNSQIYFDV